MTKTEQMIQDIEKNGVSGRGKAEMMKHLNGERLTSSQMVKAKCYDCMGYYSDGRGTDCETETCALYPLMPYRQKGPERTKKFISEENRAKAAARMKAMRAV